MHIHLFDRNEPITDVHDTAAQAQFAGYPAGALPLLATLGTCDQEWFAAHRSAYQALLAEPTKLLVTTLGKLLHESLSADLAAVPRVSGSIAPVATDRRFAAARNLPRYRDSVLLRFWEGADKATAATLALRITPQLVEFAASRSFAGALLPRYRSAVAGEDGAELRAGLATVRRRHRAHVDGRELKRVPSCYPTEHPSAELLRHRWLRVRWAEPVPRAIGSARFPKWCERRLVDLADVHGWLRDRV